VSQNVGVIGSCLFYVLGRVGLTIPKAFERKVGPKSLIRRLSVAQQLTLHYLPNQNFVKSVQTLLQT
jgi:hypothetical protein